MHPRTIVRALDTALLLAAVSIIVAAASSGCSSATEPQPPVPGEALAYPSLTEIYTAPQGLYAGCGPNNGVCHNSKQFPDLSSLGSVVDHIGDRCNQLVDDPTKMHDLCERPGDFVVVGGQRIEIGHVEAIDSDAAMPQKWRLVLAAPLPAAVAGETFLEIERDIDGEAQFVGELYDISVEIDPGDERSALVTLPPPGPAVGEEAEEDPSRLMSEMLAAAGVPADPASIQLGDPNRNGTYGAQLEGRLIKPGDPERSYILRRLTDPAAGPLMPLANCCHWSKDAVRALWCWIAGLEPDASNALDPIDYASCPPGPAVEHLAYPELGEGCEGSGMCPVQSTLPASDEPTWANVWGNVMSRRCASSGCHGGSDGSPLQLADEDAAYASLVGGGLVVAGDPDNSPLYQRVTRACGPGEACDRMPLGLDPLPAPEIEAFRGWIAAGAARQ